MKLKNKYGFTLIELLAVIVVLAIIALIATPIVMNTIKNAKKGAAERSADNYIDAVETAVATKRLDGDILEGTYTINDKGNLEGNGLTEPLVIEMNGNKPSGGTITIKDGQVTTDSKMTVRGYDVIYNPTNKKYEATEKEISSTEVLCKAETATTIGNMPSGSFNYGDEYICNLGDKDDSKNLTFFVLDKTDTEVSLIMNKNLGNTVKWSDDGSNHLDDDESKQATTAKKELSSSTVNWTRLTANQITLPTHGQIYDAIYSTGNDTNNLPTWLYFNGATSSVGYWTSTPYPDNRAFCVDSSGVMYSDGEDVSTTTNGIRPVITISKTQLG